MPAPSNPAPLVKAKREVPRGIRNGRGWLSSIKQMVRAYDKATAADDESAREDAERAIQESPLSLEIRSGWTIPGRKMEAEDFCLLLSTGGPALRLVGAIDGDWLRMEWQDWGTLWTALPLTRAQEEACAEFVRIIGVECYAHE